MSEDDKRIEELEKTIAELRLEGEAKDKRIRELEQELHRIRYYGLFKRK